MEGDEIVITNLTADDLLGIGPVVVYAVVKWLWFYGRTDWYTVVRVCVSERSAEEDAARRGPANRYGVKEFVLHASEEEETE